MKFRYSIFVLIALFFGCTDDTEIEEELILNSDIFSAITDQDVGFDSLFWNIEIDHKNEIIQGSANWFFKGSGDSLILDIGNLKISSISDRNGNLKYSEGSELGNKYVKIYNADSPIEIKYQTTASNQLVWSDSLVYFIGSPLGIKEILPIQTSPNRKFTFGAKIKTSENFIALTSAPNPQEVSNDGWYTFSQKNKIAPQQLSLIAGYQIISDIGKRSSFYHASTLERINRKQIDQIIQIFKQSEKILGPFPWEQFNIVLMPENFPFKGKQYPNVLMVSPSALVTDNTFSGSFTEFVVSAWTNQLTNNATWNDLWVNDAPSTYLTREVISSIYGEDVAHIIENYGLKRLTKDMATLKDVGAYSFTKLKTDADYNQLQLVLTSIPKEKGYQYLKYIESEYGKEAMFDFLNKFYQLNKYSSVTTEEFITNLDTILLNTDSLKMAKVSPERWVYETNIPKAIINRNRYFGKSNLSKGLALAEGIISPELIDTRSWSGWDRLLFVTLALEKDLSTERIEAIENSLKLSEYPNLSVQSLWIQELIQAKCNNYKEFTRKFVQSTGRVELLLPVYKLLISEDQTEFASELIEENKAFYTPYTNEILNNLL